MGLDMYLSKKVNVQNWESMPEAERYQISVLRGGQTVSATYINPERICYLVEEVGYWRKANAIHQWFVENVQKGVDDCGTYIVSREKLTELLGKVEHVLEASEVVPGTVTNGYRIEGNQETPITQPGQIVKNDQLAKELLPTQPGSCFGSVDYDEGYVNDMYRTRDIVTQALADELAEFEYSSSW